MITPDHSSAIFLSDALIAPFVYSLTSYHVASLLLQVCFQQQSMMPDSATIYRISKTFEGYENSTNSFTITICQTSVI